MCHIIVKEVEQFVWSFDGSFMIAIGSFMIAIGKGGIDLLGALVFWENVSTEVRTVEE
jgi:hypothetical protein